MGNLLVNFKGFFFNWFTNGNQMDLSKAQSRPAHVFMLESPNTLGTGYNFDFWFLETHDELNGGGA